MSHTTFNTTDQLNTVGNITNNKTNYKVEKLGELLIWEVVQTFTDKDKAYDYLGRCLQNPEMSGLKFRLLKEEVEYSYI